MRRLKTKSSFSYHPTTILKWKWSQIGRLGNWRLKFYLRHGIAGLCIILRIWIFSWHPGPLQRPHVFWQRSFCSLERRWQGPSSCLYPLQNLDTKIIKIKWAQFWWNSYFRKPCDDGYFCNDNDVWFITEFYSRNDILYVVSYLVGYLALRRFAVCCQWVVSKNWQVKMSTPGVAG